MQTFLEYDTRLHIEESELFSHIKDIFYVDINEIVSEEEFDDGLLNNRPKQIGLRIHHHKGEFKTQLRITINEDIDDKKRLIIGYEIAKKASTEILTGDYTGRCEFLMIDSVGNVYYTRGIEMDGELVDIEKVSEDGVNIFEFINSARAGL